MRSVLDRAALEQQLEVRAATKHNLRLQALARNPTELRQPAKLSPGIARLSINADIKDNGEVNMDLNMNRCPW